MDRHPENQTVGWVFRPTNWWAGAHPTLKLPSAGGALEPYRLLGPRKFERPSRPFTRVALAAAHVVADPPLACARMKQLLALHGCS